VITVKHGAVIRRVGAEGFLGPPGIPSRAGRLGDGPGCLKARGDRPGTSRAVDLAPSASAASPLKHRMTNHFGRDTDLRQHPESGQAAPLGDDANRVPGHPNHPRVPDTAGGLLEEALVVTLVELGLDLLDRVQADADHDE